MGLFFHTLIDAFDIHLSAHSHIVFSMANFKNNTVFNREKFAENIISGYLNTPDDLQTDRSFKFIPGNTREQPDDSADVIKSFYLEFDRPGKIS